MIRIENVTKRFGDRTVVDNISFCADKGAITGLIGSNGSGKSTTMRMISTLLKQNQGTITVGDVDTLRNPEKARGKIGLLLGGDVSLYERLTAEENILYFAELQGMDKSSAHAKICELSEILGMNDYLNRRVAGFSRGMKQKVAFARSIIHSPEVLLLDEPSTGLDIDSIKDVQNFILYCKKQEKTILLSTHNAHEMDYLCDRLVFIEDGKIIAQGDKAKLIEESGCKTVADLFFYYRERSDRK